VRIDPEAAARHPEVQALIRRKAARLADRAAGLGYDRRDAAQYLTAALLARLPAFDPARAPLAAFAAVVVTHAAADLRRFARAGKRAAPPLEPLDGATEPAVPDPGPGRVDLAGDVAVALARLPPDLRAVAEALKAGTVAAAARALGVSRAQVYGRLGEIRGHFERAGLAAYL
jgi:DNA-directed RNA polymerase specialized sigma24 family protein